MAKHKKRGQAPRPKGATRHVGWLLIAGSVLLFGGLATVDFWWPSSSKNPLAAASPQEVQRGEMLFRQYCKDCHGEQARGENPLAPQGGGKPGGGYLAPALNERGHAHHHPPDVLFGYLRNGSPAQDSPMRSFRDRLSEEDMHAVLGYVWSLWPERMQQAYESAHRH
jgi:mono/diheme cytochrome c family protein